MLFHLSTSAHGLFLRVTVHDVFDTVTPDSNIYYVPVTEWNNYDKTSTPSRCSNGTTTTSSGGENFGFNSHSRLMRLLRLFLQSNI